MSYYSHQHITTELSIDNIIYAFCMHIYTVVVVVVVVVGYTAPDIHGISFWSIDQSALMSPLRTRVYCLKFPQYNKYNTRPAVYLRWRILNRDLGPTACTYASPTRECVIINAIALSATSGIPMFYDRRCDRIHGRVKKCETLQDRGKRSRRNE